MSEQIREGIDVYRAPGMGEEILKLQEKYGIELEEAEDGVRLAMAMYDVLDTYEGPVEKPTKRGFRKEIKRLYSLAADAGSAPGMQVDQYGCPLPRYRYVASELLADALGPKQPFYDYFASVKNAPMVPNFSRTKEVIDVLIPLLLANEHPYDQPEFILPENEKHMPKTEFVDDREKANFFLTACLWMRRTDSIKAMRDLSRAFDDTRGLERDPFDPAVVATMSEDEVAGIFGKYPQLRMMAVNSKGIIHNMQFLMERFDGDIRNAYAGTQDFDEIAMRLKNDKHQEDPTKYNRKFGEGLFGFLEKMVSMLTYYLIEAECIEPFDYPPPIDQHLARLGAGTGSVRIEAEDFKDKNIMTEALLSVLRDLYYDISLKYGTDSSHIAQALWLLGSKNCSKSPETFSRILVLDGRQSEYGEYVPQYDRPGFDTNAFYQTCGSCPLNSPEGALCTHTSPGKLNHTNGKLVMKDRGKMVKPSDHSLLGEGGEAATAATAAAGRRMRAERREVRSVAYQLAKAGIKSTIPEPGEIHEQDTMF